LRTTRTYRPRQQGFCNPRLRLPTTTALSRDP
jgi:hypothetical protein